jgi:hypothetical protein
MSAAAVYASFRHGTRDGLWRGRLDLEAGVAPAWVLGVLGQAGERRSRHASTRAAAHAGRRVFVKHYAAPAGWRAGRAFRMALALERAGFAAPCAVVVGRRGAEGVLATWDVGGVPLADRLAALGAEDATARRHKHDLLRRLGVEMARLHEAGFVHGDLVPSNLQVCGGRLCFLDHDRTRRGRLLVWWGGRRNLVQLGRFAVPGVSLRDRARVLVAYARRRGLGRRRRRRLAAWLVRATIRRRCRIDGIETTTATRIGFGELMRAGGPFDHPAPGDRAARTGEGA